jgi:hypothetical protein
MERAVSKAGLNMVLLAIDASVESLARFEEDPVAFVRSFDLSSEERQALVEWDYGQMYALGAHPFILFQAVRSLAEGRGIGIPDLLADYRAAVEPHGYPDFAT